MNPQEIEELIRELMQAFQLLIESGEPISDEVYALTAQTLELLVNALDQAELKNVGVGPTTKLSNAPFASSQINGFKYDPETKELLVKFQDKFPGQNGPVYKYTDVPEFIYNIFSRGAVAPKTSGRNDWHEWKKGVTPSLGASANALLKAGGFPYQKIS